jgi:aminopeptidase N
MTNSEAIHQFGNNAYAKPAAALNVLRESVMGREVFDFAFKEYSRRWKFKRPEPADFFRSMEDASGIDLDWFWRGWFYTTKHVDVSLKALRLYEIDTRNPDIEKPLKREKRDELDGKDLIDRRNAALPKATERDRSLLDFYNRFDELDVTEKDRSDYKKFLEELDEKEKNLLALRRKFYVIELENIGGLVTPLVLEITYAGGKTETLRIPAEIWRRNTDNVRKMIITRKEITGIEFDPMQETADANRENNYWPPRAIKSRFQMHKRKKGSNPMRQAQEEAKRLKEEKEKKNKQAKDDK